MKVLIPILIGLFVVGCGKKEDGNTGVVNPNSPSTESAPEKLIINPIIVEKAIRKAAKKPTGEPTKADYDKVTELDLSNKQLTEVPKGLEKLTKLTELDLSFNQLTDVKGLGKLTQLERLSLGFNQLTDVKGLEKLDQLWGLYLSNNKLTNVKGLEKLTQLTNLLLERNPDLTKAQIAELQKALPKCKIEHNAK
jgi:Leucine-rich repeat (LRR) protein